MFLFSKSKKEAFFVISMAFLFGYSRAEAALNIPLTVTMTETVLVTGAPQIAVDVGGVTRYATYTAGSGTNTLTFTLTPQAGDLDLDGITVASPISLNGGALKDAAGNNATLTFTPPNTSGIKVNYPSLGMDFTYDADGRYTLNGTAYNDLASLLSAAGGTFTRASTATYYDSTGSLQTAASGSPRFDYDPITHAQKGILMEESRTNTLSRSSEFENAVWLRSTSTVTANVALAPDGTMTADKYFSNNGASNNDLYRSVPSAANGTTYTLSLFAKAAELPVLKLTFAGSGYSPAGTTYFDLNSCTITSGTGSIKSIGNGWCRCSITGTGASVGSDNSFYISARLLNGSLTTGDGASGIYIWGSQVEQGSYPTSYIPTTTAAVTRAADSLVIPTGAWYNQSAGSFYTSLSWESATGSGYPMFIRADDTTSNNRWNLYLTQSSGALGVDTTTSGSTQAYWSMANTVTGSARVAAAQASNNANVAFNGVIQAVDTSYTPPSITRFFLPIGTANRWYKSVKYYPARVADAQLGLITQ